MYVLITGATSGIGQALAYEYAAHGHDLILLGRRQDALEKLQKDLYNRYHIRVRGCSLDLGNIKSLERLGKWLGDEVIEIDQVIHSAGIGQFGLLESYELDKDIQMIHTNITGLTALTKILLPYMYCGGKIVFVASTAAFAPGPYMGVYYASKAYVLSLGLALREELKDRGIDVSVLCPGPTKTPFIEQAEMKKADFTQKLAMTPEQVAKCAYKGILRNRAIIVPGLANKIAAKVMGSIPPTMGVKLVGLTQKKN